MKRWLATGFIAAYLAVLGYGVGCHALSYEVGRHPLMYFVVWDMFCGWATYSMRSHVIAEGESGKYYELTPAPWGEFEPWGPAGRHNFDPFNNHMGRVAANALKHTQHEPIARVFVIEECWPKRYELPAEVWKLRYGDEPQTPNRYYHRLAELTPDGQYQRRYPSWLVAQHARSVRANPRLELEAARCRPIVLSDARNSDTPSAGSREIPPFLSAPSAN